VFRQDYITLFKLEGTSYLVGTHKTLCFIESLWYTR